jgi:hypothetical protein
VWGRESNNRPTTIDELHAAGFDGDCYLRPVHVSDEMTEYGSSYMYIDPSGRGRDETSYAIVKQLYGQLFLLEVGGFKDGYGIDTLNALAMAALRQKVNQVICEDNFGDGMFTALLTPVIIKVHRCSIEGDTVHGQKELRIIDTLQPVAASHKLIVSQECIEKDLQVASENPEYSWAYQWTHITRDKGSLNHEDRLEAIASAVRKHVEAMARDTDAAHEEHKEQIQQDELKSFMHSFDHRGYTSEDDNPDDLWVVIQ